MSQKTNNLYNLVNNPIIYMLFQKLMSGTSFRKKIIESSIIKKKVKILDIGCGPAEILNYLPDVNYYGYDIDKRSIEYAKKKYINNKKCNFFCKNFTKKEISKLPKFDYVILFGILHHLENREVKNILNLCKKVMKKNALLLTEDPIFLKKQNFIAKFLIKNDRGLNVREEYEYKNLVKPYFKNIKAKISHQLFIPYTWFTMKCKN